HHIPSAFRVCAGLLVAVAVAGCSGDRFGTGSAPSMAQPSAPPTSMAGRWLFASPGRGQCRMTFGQAAPTAAEGTIAPEGGCPGKFFTSRKWAYEQDSLIMRDHNGQPLAQLTAAGAAFNGKATSGEPVTLTR